METWKLIIELEFPVLDEDTKEIHVGDAEVDFANRAVERVRSALDKLLETSEFAHYYIMPLRGNKMARR